jgi:hypothetical protein
MTWRRVDLSGGGPEAEVPEEGVLELAGDLVADRVLDEVAGHAGVEAHAVTRGCLEVAGEVGVRGFCVHRLRGS